MLKKFGSSRRKLAKDSGVSASTEQAKPTPDSIAEPADSGFTTGPTSYERFLVPKGQGPKCISCLSYVALEKYLKNDHVCDSCLKKNPIGKHTSGPLCARILDGNKRCDVPLEKHINMGHDFHVRDNK